MSKTSWWFFEAQFRELIWALVVGAGIRAASGTFGLGVCLFSS
jgi:hypothetical protein